MKKTTQVKFFSWLAVFIALSAVGAAIKVPSHVGSVALDSFPALAAAALMGSGAGAMVAALGHLVSAMISGFPLGPMHLIIAAEMAILVWLFGFIYRKNKTIISGLIFIFGNTIVAPLPFIFLISKAFFILMLPSLFVGSLINTVITLVVVPRLVSVVNPKISEGK
ncbi:ECF transporter S component [Bacillus sp. JJ1764]|uniref:ECF transporter S component n=1 Tax=Bacillus sp. JJ1764 TaxID=3122964 RepID=UPI003000E30D